MEKAELSGQTILIVQNNLDSAIPLQDRIVEDGGRVLTAYSLARAKLLIERTALSGAVIDLALTGAHQLVDLLKMRNVPYIFDAAPTKRCCEANPGLSARETVVIRSGQYPSASPGMD